MRPPPLPFPHLQGLPAVTTITLALGVQHWLSPQIEFRPEIAWYRANDAKAFDGNSNHGVIPNRQQATILSADAILHF